MKKLRILPTLICAGVVFLFASCNIDAYLHDSADRKITVTGVSTVYAAPDTASIRFAIVSQDKNISAVKQKNDIALKKVTEVFTRYNIPSKNISIDRLSISPQYSYRDDEPRFLYYTVNQDISVTLDNLENYELFFMDLLNAGVTSVQNVEFSVQDMKKLRNDARIAAVKAAEEKAATLCDAAENGGKKLTIGKIISIKEFSESSSYQLSYQNAVLAKATDSASAAEPIGQIQIDAQVEIVFQLK